MTFHRRRRLFCLHFFLLLVYLVRQSSAQLVNGQFFTSGLAIIDSPAPNGYVPRILSFPPKIQRVISDSSKQHAGSNMPIAIDVSNIELELDSTPQPVESQASGNGKLEMLPNTGFISINIFLISSTIGVNVTVSTGPSLIDGEPSSTVKHLDWLIPSCLPSGNYNVRSFNSTSASQQLYGTPTVDFLRSL